MNHTFDDYQVKTRKILKECKALIDGSHFIYSSGRHGDFYINKDAIYMHPKVLDDVAYMLTCVALNAFSISFDVILSPTMGGMILGNAVSYNATLISGKEILFAYSESDPDHKLHRIIRRGYDSIIKDKNILLVDDIVTTGTTMVGMARAALRLGGNVLGGISICNRNYVRNIKFYPDNVGNDTVAFDLNIVPLVELDLRTFSSSECPFCKAGRPIDPRLGKGGRISD